MYSSRKVILGTIAILLRGNGCGENHVNEGISRG